MKKAAVESYGTPRSIATKNLKNSSPETIMRMPRMQAIFKQISRWKTASSLPHSNPTNLSEIDIDETLWTTSNGEKFVYYEDPPDEPNRLFIFTTEKNLEILNGCSIHCVDGTFKVSFLVVQVVQVTFQKK